MTTTTDMGTGFGNDSESASRGETRADAMTDVGDRLVQRLRAVRRKLSRWLPSSEMLALWSQDYEQVYHAATRLELAVKAFDARMDASARGLAIASQAELEKLLEHVESRAEEFEKSIVANVMPTN